MPRSGCSALHGVNPNYEKKNTIRPENYFRMTQKQSNDGLSGKFQKMLLGKYQSLTSDIKNIKSTLADSVKLHGLTIDRI